MIDFFKNLQRKWNDWCGDKEMESSIRRTLQQQGYFGNTAQLQNVRLVAVQRPGWIQVFRFEARARVNFDAGTEGEVIDEGPDRPAEYHQLFGLVREDMRKNQSNVSFFDNEDERRVLFREWSEDLICLRGAHGLG